MSMKLYEHSRNENWSKIAQDIEGKYINGGFWESDLLKYKYKVWEIILDTYSVHINHKTTICTRMRAPFISKDNLRFKIYRKGFLSFMSRLFGTHHITIGDLFIDKKIIIKGNNRDKIVQLLNSEKIKELIQNLPKICLEIRDDEGLFEVKFPSNVDELYFQCVGVINEKKVLLNLVDSFNTALDGLVKIDSAYENDPNVHII